MTSLPTVDFARIREHDGAQHRAWEELCYEVVRDLDDIGTATLERRGTPDGGVEFTCTPTTSGNGGRWAWQAKYLFKFDASTFSQMKHSLFSALDDMPDLERYIFVLPKDRSTAAVTKWKKQVKIWMTEVETRIGHPVTLAFHGESDVLAALAKDHHAGVIRYFFDKAFLTSGFFIDQVAREATNLGTRYIPEANVETEARQFIDAACRAPTFVDRFKLLIGNIPERVHYIPDETVDQLVKTVVADTDSLLADWREQVIPAIDRIGAPGDDVFDDLATVTQVLSKGLTSQLDHLRTQVEVLDDESRAAGVGQDVDASSRSAKSTPAEVTEQTRERYQARLLELQSMLYSIAGSTGSLLRFLDGDVVRAAKKGRLLMVGEAGCGKSHLVAEVASDRTNHEQPSLLVLGQTLSLGRVEPQISAAVGLSDVDLEEIVQALETAARLRGEGRALLVIDALNEGPGADLWEHQLPGLLHRLSQYEWLATVVTIRNVYENAVIPGPIDAVRVEHRGLVGHEEELLGRYAKLYALRIPDVPMLLPELTNPLFVRSVCQSVAAKGLTSIPREATGLMWVFDGLIDFVDQALRIPSRLDYGPSEQKARRAVEAIAGLRSWAGRGE